MTLSKTRHDKISLYVVAIIGFTTIVMMSCISSTQIRMKESYQDVKNTSIKAIDAVGNMNEPPERRLKFASALLMYDPRLQKYQDPRSYDFHTCGNATQMWKAKFREFLKDVGDNVVNRVLEYKDVIVLFDMENLVGNVIFIPLEGSYPQSVVDPVVFRKYIKWNPPSNIISAIIPQGFKLRVDFEAIDAKGSVVSKTIQDGITKTFVIAAPIKEVVIMRV